MITCTDECVTYHIYLSDVIRSISASMEPPVLSRNAILTNRRSINVCGPDTGLRDSRFQHSESQIWQSTGNVIGLLAIKLNKYHCVDSDTQNQEHDKKHKI